MRPPRLRGALANVEILYMPIVYCSFWGYRHIGLKYCFSSGRGCHWNGACCLVPVGLPWGSRAFHTTWPSFAHVKPDRSWLLALVAAETLQFNTTMPHFSLTRVIFLVSAFRRVFSLPLNSLPTNDHSTTKEIPHGRSYIPSRHFPVIRLHCVATCLSSLTTHISFVATQHLYEASIDFLR